MIRCKRGADVLRPLSPKYPDDETFPDLLIVRPEGRIFFVNAQQVAEGVGAPVEEHRPQVILLDMSRVPDIEYSALQALIDGEQRASERGGTLWLAVLNPGVLDVVRRSGLAEHLGRDRLLFNDRVAIEHFQSLVAEAEASAASLG